MKITVAICTWNRQALLDQTLAQMHKLRIPEGVNWELLVVNNNCTDSTDEVIAKHSRFLPIRRILESLAGLSNARNAAVREATGDYLLWTDDDVLVDESWIEAYVSAFERWPEAAIFGGPIAPWFEGEPPQWLLSVWPKVADAYAVRDLGPSPIAVGAKTLPFGANYALSLPRQRHYIYDPRLGRKEKGMLGSEETDLIQAMLKNGLHGLWVPDARVSHFIPRSRQNCRYLRRYFQGRGLYLTRVAEASRVATLFGYPRWLIKRALQAELAYRAHRLTSPPAIWIEALMRASICWGQLEGFSSQLPALDIELDQGA